MVGGRVSKKSRSLLMVEPDESSLILVGGVHVLLLLALFQLA